jgi:hypothetical protein
MCQVFLLLATSPLCMLIAGYVFLGDGLLLSENLRYSYIPCLHMCIWHMCIWHMCIWHMCIICIRVQIIQKQHLVMFISRFCLSHVQIAAQGTRMCPHMTSLLIQMSKSRVPCAKNVVDYTADRDCFLIYCSRSSGGLPAGVLCLTVLPAHVAMLLANTL